MSKRRKRLVLFLYSTSTQNLVFAHQIHVAVDLSRYFEETIVITAQSDFSFDAPFTNVIDLEWNGRNTFSKICNLVKVFFCVIFAKRHETVIFSYMTEVQSAILAPLTKLTHIPHYLWYAHTKKSIYLRWCHFWLDKIVTSTSDSCPYDDHKIMPIGQSIDENLFRYSSKTRSNIKRGVSVSRLDPSKNLEIIIDILNNPIIFSQIDSITFIGTNTPGNETYLQNIQKQNNHLIKEKRLFFLGQIPNRELPQKLLEYDFFLNAFDGSLDKSLIEATMIGLPVITTNSVYLNSFGSWSNIQGSNTAKSSLLEELNELLNLPSANREAICRQRAELAFQNHSRNQWIPRLVEILNSK